MIKAIKKWYKYSDLLGNKHIIKADEKQTRLFLHEIDHLDGSICCERYIKGTTKFVTGGKEEVLGFSFKRIK